MAGLIDWSAIEDRTRNLKRVSTWDDPGAVIASCVYSFELDHWKNQEYYVEVWIEKEALIGVIETICRKLHVGWFACKGYISKSEMYASARRMSYYRSIKREPIIIHLGDHDPSGIDMTRDISDQHSVFDGTMKVKRIALNMDQVEQYNPPPNPTKMKDSRSSDYENKFGKSCWELDALEPSVMQRLINEEVLKYRDNDIYLATLKQEAEYKATLEHVAENWEKL